MLQLSASEGRGNKKSLPQRRLLESLRLLLSLFLWCFNRFISLPEEIPRCTDGSKTSSGTRILCARALIFDSSKYSYLKKSCSSTLFFVNGEMVMNMNRNATISFYQTCGFSWLRDKEPQRRDFLTEAVSTDPLWEPHQQHHGQLYPIWHDNTAGFSVKVNSTLH